MPRRVERKQLCPSGPKSAPDGGFLYRDGALLRPPVRLCRDLVSVCHSGRKQTKPAPNGAKELSPALQRWVAQGTKPSPFRDDTFFTRSVIPGARPNIYIGLALMLIREHIALAPFTTLGVGGPARYFAEAKSESEVIEAAEVRPLASAPNVRSGWRQQPARCGCRLRRIGAEGWYCSDCAISRWRTTT